MSIPLPPNVVGGANAAKASADTAGGGGSGAAVGRANAAKASVDTAGGGGAAAAKSKAGGESGAIIAAALGSMEGSGTGGGMELSGTKGCACVASPLASAASLASSYCDTAAMSTGFRFTT